MTTILHITPAYKPAYIYGGPTFSVSRLCEELNKTTLSVIVLTTTANGAAELDVATNKSIKLANVDIHYCKRITGDHSHFSPALLWKLIKLIKKSKASPNHQLIVHVHSWWNTVAIAAALIAKCYGVPVVVSPRGVLTPYSMHNSSRILKSIIHQLISKPLLKRCHIHATTALEKEDLKSIAIKAKKVHIIPNLPTFRSHHIQQQEALQIKSPLKILFLSRIEEKKGLNLLFKALSKLKIPWHLTIAGEGKLDYINILTRYAVELNIYKRITWIDGIYGKSKFDCIKQHDFLVLASYNENFANVILESLSVGTPVILSKTVGLTDYVLKRRLGWATNLEPEQIAKTIEKAASQLHERKRIRKEAPQLIKNDFREKDLIAHYVNMYKNMLQHES